MQFFANLRATWRLLAFFIFISFYLLFAFLIVILFQFSKGISQQMLAKNVSFFCKLGVILFGIRIEQVLAKNVNLNDEYLMVGNHLSYIDIIALSSIKPTLFVTSTEMRDSAGLGLLCKMAGCVFVDRRNKLKIKNEIKELTEALDNHLSITFFPEATSSNGEALLKFRMPLFEAAIISEKAVLPFCLNYKTVNYEKVNLKNRDFVFWYGDMTFFSHFWSFLKQKETTLHVHFFHPIDPHGLSREDLCLKSFEEISRAYCPVS